MLRSTGDVVTLVVARSAYAPSSPYANPPSLPPNAISKRAGAAKQTEDEESLHDGGIFVASVDQGKAEEGEGVARAIDVRDADEEEGEIFEESADVVDEHGQVTANCTAL